ncbi:hypothetical protein [Pseudomonas sp. St316]|nr:hypothetical protein [Pseudomonas sp. St316]
MRKSHRSGSCAAFVLTPILSYGTSCLAVLRSYLAFRALNGLSRFAQD